MTDVRNTEKVIIRRITDYGPKPRSSVQALQQAHAFLTEEGQWTAGDFFKDGDPKEAFEKGMCSSMSACSMGALGLVTGEAPVKVIREAYDPDPEYDEYEFSVLTEYNEADTPLSVAAAVRIAKALDPEWELEDDYDHKDRPIKVKIERDSWEAVEAVISYNDRGNTAGFGGTGKRTQVLDAFADAIRQAGREPLIDHTRSQLSIKRQLNKVKRQVKG